MPDDQAQRIWRIRSRRHSFEWEGPLVAQWAVELDAISDNYTPDEISAAELLRRWQIPVMEAYPNGLVPIDWVAESPGHIKAEPMPFQHPLSTAPDEHFLTHYEWPEDSETGELLNWLSIPVVDKQWDAKGANTGGFIQEATGWKPSILQPFVYVPGLLQAARF